VHAIKDVFTPVCTHAVHKLTFVAPESPILALPTRTRYTSLKLHSSRSKCVPARLASEIAELFSISQTHSRLPPRLVHCELISISPLSRSVFRAANLLAQSSYAEPLQRKRSFHNGDCAPCTRCRTRTSWVLPSVYITFNGPPCMTRTLILFWLISMYISNVRLLYGGWK
jgi:hypothetical protein